MKFQTEDGINLLNIETRRDRTAKMRMRRASWTLGAGFGAGQAKTCPDSSPVTCWPSRGIRFRTLGEKFPIANAIVASLYQKSIRRADLMRRETYTMNLWEHVKLQGRHGLSLAGRPRQGYVRQSNSLLSFDTRTSGAVINQYPDCVPRRPCYSGAGKPGLKG
jgi:hypothetical protein